MQMCPFGATRLPGKDIVKPQRNNEKTLCLQDMVKCSPRGRYCIEQNSALSFNCSVNCEGIYADVQWLEGMVEVKGRIEKKGEELDRKKYMRLLHEYKHFKKDIVRHFRFDGQSEPNFGRFQHLFSF